MFRKGFKYWKQNKEIVKIQKRMKQVIIIDGVFIFKFIIKSMQLSTNEYISTKGKPNMFELIKKNEKK